MLFGCDNFSWATEFPFPHLDKNDTIIMTQLPYHDAGAAGDNMIWDFSTVDLSEGKDYAIALNYLSDSTFCAQEHRTRYYWHVSGDSLYCTGYENATTYLPYSSPELRYINNMQETDTLFSSFGGQGEYGHLLPLFVSGITRVWQDATGHIILPGADTIRDVKRLYTKKHYIEIFSDTTTIELHQWQWFKRGYPYPVFETMNTIRAERNNEDTTLFGMSLLFSPEQQKEQLSLAIEETGHDVFQAVDIITNISFLPNPVDDHLIVSYYLTRDAEVGMSLHSPSGIIIYNMPAAVQSDGLHQLTISMSGQIPGTYMLYIEVDNDLLQNVIIKK